MNLQHKAISSNANLLSSGCSRYNIFLSLDADDVIYVQIKKYKGQWTVFVNPWGIPLVSFSSTVLIIVSAYMVCITQTRQRGKLLLLVLSSKTDGCALSKAFWTYLVAAYISDSLCFSTSQTDACLLLSPRIKRQYHLFRSVSPSRLFRGLFPGAWATRHSSFFLHCAA